MKHSRLHLASRVAASLLGAYIFVWGGAVLCIALLLAAGMAYGDARTLVYLLAFLVFLACFCWAFAATSLTRVWSVLGGGGAVMIAAAWLLSQSPA